MLKLKHISREFSLAWRDEKCQYILLIFFNFILLYSMSQIVELRHQQYFKEILAIIYFIIYLQEIENNIYNDVSLPIFFT